MSPVVFNFHSKFKVVLNSDSATAAQLVTNGVTIASGGVASILDAGSSVLPLGTVFTIINNTAATPISGTFNNLPDGGTVTVGSNTVQANYEGGDGNDLTLTVLP
jgi:hypothetical protein